MRPLVGESVPVIDAKERVNGSLAYVLDFELPGMIYGKIVRSPHPHARILSIDTSAAESMPGVRAVVTADSPGRMRGRRYGRFFLDQALLAEDRVRFVGEPIAAVAATNEELAAEAAERIEVQYETLPAVFDIEDALAPDAPMLHSPRPHLREEMRSMIAGPSEVSNLCSYFKVRHGSLEQGLEESDLVFTDEFRTPAVQHVPLEPHVAVATFERRLTVWSSTQMPHAIRAQLAELFGLSMADVRVITFNLGGGFGAKGSLRLEPIASLLSQTSHQPVKITLDRAEEFMTVTKHASRISITSGVTKDGLLKARQVTAYYNTGAYADVGPMVARNAGSALVGPYRIPHVSVDSHAVWTNLVPAGAFRGFGVAQGAWAYEAHTDMLADRLAIDPVEFRRRNLLRSGDRYVTGEIVQDMHFDKLLDRVIESMGTTPREPGAERQATGGRSRRGRAFATTMKATITPSTSTAALRMNEDGSVNVLTSSVDLGQGVKTVLAQMVADALGLSLDRIQVSEPDTDLTPYDQQTSSSRSTYSMGNAVTVAAGDLRLQLMQAASEKLEAAIEDLELADGAVGVRGVPASRITFGDIVQAGRRGNLQATGAFITEGGLDPESGQGLASVHWHHGAAGCEVEVDLDTGKVEVVGLSAAVFAGRVINPRLCELQVEGSVLFALGQALFEEMSYEYGQVVNANLSDYMIPSFEDVPEQLEAILVEAEGSEDIHGVGETALPPVSPAIANAVHDAIGVRITSLPITAEKVLKALIGSSPSPLEQEIKSVQVAS